MSRRVANLLAIWSGGLALGTAAALYSGNERFYRDTAMPLLHRLLEPERAHRLALRAVAAAGRFLPRRCSGLEADDAAVLSSRAFGRAFAHPLGLAAGFDKDAEALDGLLAMGFSFVEVGSVTPLAQLGNPRPRIFRLAEDAAVINRCGFNSAGHDAVAANLLASDWLARRPDQSEEAEEKESPAWVGVNLGVNRGSADPAADYRAGAEKFASLADYLVVNVSSPNTPGLRDLQRRQQLLSVVDAVVAGAEESATKSKRLRRPRVLLKVSPDCTDSELADICSVALSRGIDGLVVSNTTVTRPAELRSRHAIESGGLSGRPLAPLSNRAIAAAYRHSGGRLTIVGVGGVDSGADALAKLEAGASLLQLYTALTIEGPPVLARINRELAQLLRQRGYRTAAEAVGAAHRPG